MTSLPIDTRIEGSPDGVRATAGWLRSILADEISQTVDSIYSARNTARGGWEGLSGDAFVARMSSGATNADGLETATVDSAQAMDDYAAEMQRAQNDMQRIRDDAASAGLTVDGFVIREPGPAPPDPGSPPTGSAATPAAVSNYNAAVAATDRHARLVAAYNTALSDAAAARRVEKVATGYLNDVWEGVESKWSFVVGDLINGVAGGLAAAHASTLLKQSKYFADESAKYMNLAKTAPPGSPAALVYRDYDHARAFARGAEDTAKTAGKVDSKAGRVGLKVGGALALGGVVYDVANGKDVDQAIVSGGAGFGASVAAGALAGAALGSLVPLPGVGTVAGAAVGVVAGVFTSGAVDSLWENGMDSVGDAIGDGADAVVDTSKAIGGLAESAWNAVF